MSRPPTRPPPTTPLPPVPNTNNTSTNTMLNMSSRNHSSAALPLRSTTPTPTLTTRTLNRTNALATLPSLTTLSTRRETAPRTPTPTPTPAEPTLRRKPSFKTRDSSGLNVEISTDHTVRVFIPENDSMTTEGDSQLEAALADNSDTLPVSPSFSPPGPATKHTFPPSIFSAVDEMRTPTARDFAHPGRTPYPPCRALSPSPSPSPEPEPEPEELLDGSEPGTPLTLGTIFLRPDKYFKKDGDDVLLMFDISALEKEERNAVVTFVEGWLARQRDASRGRMSVERERMDKEESMLAAYEEFELLAAEDRARRHERERTREAEAVRMRKQVGFASGSGSGFARHITAHDELDRQRDNERTREAAIQAVRAHADFAKRYDSGNEKTLPKPRMQTYASAPNLREPLTDALGTNIVSLLPRTPPPSLTPLTPSEDLESLQSRLKRNSCLTPYELQVLACGLARENEALNEALKASQSPDAPGTPTQLSSPSCSSPASTLPTPPRNLRRTTSTASGILRAGWAAVRGSSNPASSSTPVRAALSTRLNPNPVPGPTATLTEVQHWLNDFEAGWNAYCDIVAGHAERGAAVDEYEGVKALYAALLKEMREEKREEQREPEKREEKKSKRMKVKHTKPLPPTPTARKSQSDANLRRANGGAYNYTTVGGAQSAFVEMIPNLTPNYTAEIPNLTPNYPNTNTQDPRPSSAASHISAASTIPTQAFPASIPTLLNLPTLPTLPTLLNMSNVTLRTGTPQEVAVAWRYEREYAAAKAYMDSTAHLPATQKADGGKEDGTAGKPPVDKDKEKKLRERKRSLAAIKDAVVDGLKGVKVASGTFGRSVGKLRGRRKSAVSIRESSFGVGED